MILKLYLQGASALERTLATSDFVHLCASPGDLGRDVEVVPAALVGDQMVAVTIWMGNVIAALQ